MSAEYSIIISDIFAPCHGSVHALILARGKYKISCIVQYLWVQFDTLLQPSARRYTYTRRCVHTHTYGQKKKVAHKMRHGLLVVWPKSSPPHIRTVSSRVTWVCTAVSGPQISQKMLENQKKERIESVWVTKKSRWSQDIKQKSLQMQRLLRIQKKVFPEMGLPPLPFSDSLFSSLFPFPQPFFLPFLRKCPLRKHTFNMKV